MIRVPVATQLDVGSCVRRVAQVHQGSALLFLVSLLGFILTPINVSAQTPAPPASDAPAPPSSPAVAPSPDTTASVGEGQSAASAPGPSVPPAPASPAPKNDELPPAPAPAPATSDEGGAIPAAAPVTPTPAEERKAAAANPAQLKAVVVTAQRREESVQKVPTAISVLSGDTLVDKDIGRSAGEVLNYVPNASATTQLHGRPRWWIRGVGTGQQQMDFANPIGFYLDDVYISNATATGFPLFDLDRVEVLRGPQGTLWGKNTTGGAIAIISRRPSFDANDGYLKLETGSYNDHIFEGAGNGVIIRNRLAARASFHLETGDGRFTNLFDGRSSGEFQDAAVRLQILGKITDDLTAIANVHYRKYTTSGTITTVLGSGTDGAYRDGYVPSTNILDVNSNFPSTSDARQGGANLNLNWKLGDYALTSISGFEQYKELSQGDDSTPLNISKSWSDAISQQVSEELRLTSPRANFINWVVGAFYFHETIKSGSASGKIGGPWGLPSTIPASYSFTKFTHSNDSLAPFASVTANLSTLFKVTGGLRWTWEHRKLDSVRVANYGNPVFTDYDEWWNPALIGSSLQYSYDVHPSNTWTNFTYDISPSVAITDNVNAYVRFAHGVKSGGYNTSATSAGALNVVQPEKLNAYEVGGKASWLDKRLTTNASAFYYDYRDVQINVVGVPLGYSTSVSYLQNANKARIYGAEFELEALPVRFLHLAGNLGLLDAKFTDFQVQNNGGDNSGNSLVRSPKVSTQVIADIIVPLQGTTKLVLGGDVNYKSKQQYYTTDQGNPYLNQVGYTLVNARVTLSTAEEKLNLTFYAANLLDTRYKQHTTPGAAGATGNNVMWGAPRTIGLSLVSRWW